MSDTPQRPEGSADDQAVEKITELPDKVLSDKDADAVKGGVGMFGNVIGAIRPGGMYKPQ